jgi:DNA polymerase III alpha subunit
LEIPGGATEFQHLEKLSREGLRHRGKAGKPEYEKRLSDELEVIRRLREEKGLLFDRYFLIVADYVNWAWEHGIRVGAGRGSGAGSLILYCLRVTGIDPLPYGLLFERFLSEDRIQMPDIDIDFDSERAAEVYDYVCRKYGENRCARIGTVGMFHAASAIKSAYKVFDPGNTYEAKRHEEQVRKNSQQQPTVRAQRASAKNGSEYQGDETARLANLATKMLPRLRQNDKNPDPRCTLRRDVYEADRENRIYVYEKSDELRDLKFRYGELFSVAESFEDLVEKRGTHAAGVLITDEPTICFAPQQYVGRAKSLATAYDMDDLEKIGGIKFDFLRTKVLSVITRSVALIAQRHGKQIPIDDLVPNDQKVFSEVFASGQTDAVFQFESDGMKKMLVEMRPDRFEDVIAANALFRPGPMEYIESYVKRKHGKESVSYPAAALEQVLRETYGIMVYQEQVMQVTRVLAGFSGCEADKVRKAMGKKKRDVLDSMREKFLQGCRKGETCQEAVASKIWEDMEHFADYAFNKSMDENTLVSLASRKKKFLKDIKCGDIVRCFDGYVMKNTEVVSLHDHGMIEGIEIEFDDGTREICSVRHKFLTACGMMPLYEILSDNIEVLAKENNDNVPGQSHTRRLAFRRIVSARPVGKRHMFDLEVRHFSHNFILESGIITSNSHAAGYGYTAYQCAFLKTYYPAEFMASQLTVEGGDASYDAVEKYEKKLYGMGIRVLPLDLNESKDDYVICGFGDSVRLRKGFKGVKGIGEEAYKDLVANQPFSDMYDFCSRGNLATKSDVARVLVDMGAFDFLIPKMSEMRRSPVTKADILREFDQMMKRAKAQKRSEDAAGTKSSMPKFDFASSEGESEGLSFDF